jgi:hypothetical protein
VDLEFKERMKLKKSKVLLCLLSVWGGGGLCEYKISR